MMKPIQVYLTPAERDVLDRRAAELGSPPARRHHPPCPSRPSNSCWRSSNRIAAVDERVSAGTSRLVPMPNPDA